MSRHRSAVVPNNTTTVMRMDRQLSACRYACHCTAKGSHCILWMKLDCSSTVGDSSLADPSTSGCTPAYRLCKRASAQAAVLAEGDVEKVGPGAAGLQRSAVLRGRLSQPCCPQALQAGRAAMRRGAQALQPRHALHLPASAWSARCCRSEQGRERGALQAGQPGGAAGVRRPGRAAGPPALPALRAPARRAGARPGAGDRGSRCPTSAQTSCAYPERSDSVDGQVALTVTVGRAASLSPACALLQACDRQFMDA